MNKCPPDFFAPESRVHLWEHGDFCHHLIHFKQAIPHGGLAESLFEIIEDVCQFFLRTI